MQVQQEERQQAREAQEALDNKPLLMTTEPIECPICMSEVPAGEGVRLHNCIHEFCMCASH